MADFISTRRGVIGAMVLAPMAITAPAAAASSDFAAKLATFVKAENAAIAHDRNVYGPALQRFEEAEAAISHRTVEWNGETWSTANPKNVAEARYAFDPRHTRKPDASAQPYRDACLVLAKAADTRELAVKRAREKAGVDAAADEADVLDAVRYKAMLEVIRCPVSSAHDLAAKICFATDHDQWEFDDTRDSITADAARIAALAHA